VVEGLGCQPDAKLMLLSCTPSLQDIGGYDIQKQEIREAVELPLTHAGLYQQLGIDPPRGVLLYGPPGEQSSSGQQGAASVLQQEALLNHLAANYSTSLHVLQVLARLCLPRQWHTTQQQHSSEWWAPSLCRSTWERYASAHASLHFVAVGWALQLEQ
jgi:hypothetical protein